MKSISKFSRYKSLVAAAGVAVLACSAASAQQAGDRASTNAKSAASMAPAAVGAAAPNARLAALVQSGGRVLRSKNVAGVYSPRPGIYCIRPSTNINLNTMIAVVSVEYFYSDFGEAMVNWRSDHAFNCPSGRIEVYTLGDPDENGSYVLSDGIAFSILVP